MRRTIHEAPNFANWVSFWHPLGRKLDWRHISLDVVVKIGISPAGMSFHSSFRDHSLYNRCIAVYKWINTDLLLGLEWQSDWSVRNSCITRPTIQTHTRTHRQPHIQEVHTTDQLFVTFRVDTCWSKLCRCHVEDAEKQAYCPKAWIFFLTPSIHRSSPAYVYDIWSFHSNEDLICRILGNLVSHVPDYTVL